ncbi:MAG: type II toxin-antitoxin system VapC family toxin [Anaerolineae bacterium]|nr:type II toxin-antitoxin system VapC family toxin [Anaerolineae bacterium]
MRLLLDTHAFIWLDIATSRLSTTIQQAIKDPQNDIYLSLASVWEMQIKIQLGKLQLDSTLPITLTSQQQTNGIQLLPIRLDHILGLGHLPYHHHDPFDRLLIAQTQVENLTLVTNDPKIHQYQINILW